MREIQRPFSEPNFLGISKQIFKDNSALGVCYRDLQARVCQRETRNLTPHEVQPSAVLNFEFLVCKRVLVNPDNAGTKSAANVLIFSLSKPLK